MNNVHPLPGVDDKADPDIVQEVLRRVIAMAPGFSDAQAKQIEQQVKAELGGRRLYVPKGAWRRLSPQEQQQVYQDGLTNMPDAAVTAKHKISGATLKRLMKRGPR